MSTPTQSIANSVDAAQYFPQTVYITARGKQTFVHAGPYEIGGGARA